MMAIENAEVFKVNCTITGTPEQSGLPGRVSVVFVGFLWQIFDLTGSIEPFTFDNRALKLTIFQNRNSKTSEQ